MLECSNDVIFTQQWRSVGVGVRKDLYDGNRQLGPDIQIFLHLIFVRAKNM